MPNLKKHIGLAVLSLGLCGLAVWLGMAKWGRGGEFRPRHRRFVRFALCQYDARVNDVRWSFEHALDYAAEAVRHNADVVVLPEFSFATVHDVRTGKAVFDILSHPVYAKRLTSFARRNGCYLFFNHPSSAKDVSRKALTRRYNTSYVMEPTGEIVAKYRKRNLAILDEECRFSPGTESVIADLPFGRVGMMICKDAFTADGFLPYRVADLVVVQFANITHWADTPAPAGLQEPTFSVRGKMAAAAEYGAKRLRKPILMVNKSGLEGDFAYIGESCATLANGTSLASAGSDCSILYVDFPLDEKGRIDHRRSPTSSNVIWEGVDD